MLQFRKYRRVKQGHWLARQSLYALNVVSSFETLHHISHCMHGYSISYEFVELINIASEISYIVCFYWQRLHIPPFLYFLTRSLRGLITFLQVSWNFSNKSNNWSTPIGTILMLELLLSYNFIAVESNNTRHQSFLFLK